MRAGGPRAQTGLHDPDELAIPSPGISGRPATGAWSVTANRSSIRKGRLQLTSVVHAPRAHHPM